MNNITFYWASLSLIFYLLQNKWMPVKSLKAAFSRPLGLQLFRSLSSASFSNRTFSLANLLSLANRFPHRHLPKSMWIPKRVFIQIVQPQRPNRFWYSTRSSVKFQLLNSRLLLHFSCFQLSSTESVSEPSPISLLLLYCGGNFSGKSYKLFHPEFARTVMRTG